MREAYGGSSRETPFQKKLRQLKQFFKLFPPLTIVYVRNHLNKITNKIKNKNR